MKVRIVKLIGNEIACDGKCHGNDISKEPFCDRIFDHEKVYETRRHPTLNQFLSKTVYVCESGKQKTMIVGEMKIADCFIVRTKDEWDMLAPLTCVDPHGEFGWDGNPRWLYRIENARRVKPRAVPSGSKIFFGVYAEIKE